MSKINVGQIVTDHLATLKHAHSGDYSGFDLFVFYGLPFLMGVASIFLHAMQPARGLVGVLITSFSIFAALLFNLLILLFDLITRGGPKANSFKRMLLRESYSNIAYSILVALVMTIFSLAFLILPEGHASIDGIFSLLFYLLAGNFVLTLFMVLKRVHIMLTEEFKQDSAD